MQPIKVLTANIDKPNSTSIDVYVESGYGGGMGYQDDDFRVSPGFGLRITVPAMGPAPIALDFAFPVLKADTDDTEVFSFFIGLQR